MDLDPLRQTGLNDSEIKVYFALLQLESSTVGSIINRAKVSDSKIYVILDKLKEKGLVTYVIKNNVKHYQASDPKNLLYLINEKQQSLSNLKKQFEENIIPAIEIRRKLTADKQEATVYESFEGIKAAFNFLLDSLSSNDEYQVFMLGESLSEKRVITFFRNYHKKRIEKNISIRLISERIFEQTIKKYHKYSKMKIRFTKQKLPVGTFIFASHVMTVIWSDNPTAFVIKSKRNYEYCKDFFDYMWKRSDS